MVNVCENSKDLWLKTFLTQMSTKNYCQAVLGATEHTFWSGCSDGLSRISVSTYVKEGWNLLPKSSNLISLKTVNSRCAL